MKKNYYIEGICEAIRDGSKTISKTTKELFKAIEDDDIERVKKIIDGMVTG